MSRSEVFPIVVMMGVSGAGKSTCGEAVAKALRCRFSDADAFHPKENVAKMSSGIPLNDDDRREWLALLAAHMAQAYRERDVTGDKALVLACSALKARYRDTLTSWCADELHSETARPLVLFCVLHARCEVLVERLEQRSRAGGHFMPPSLLQSQLDTLEMPSPGAQDDFSANMAIDVESAEPDQVAVQVLAELTRLGALVPPQ